MEPVIKYIYDGAGRIVAAVVSGIVGNADARDNRALKGAA